MFEYHQYSKLKHLEKFVDLPADTPALPKLKTSALLLWGEHCTECAVPECYTTCTLYDPRPDNKCRRFEFGIGANDSLQNSQRSTAEVKFKKWGRLKTAGNAYMKPLWQIRLLEKLILLWLKTGDLFFSLLSRVTRKPDHAAKATEIVERVVYFLGKFPNKKQPPDGFLIDIYNPSNLTLSLRFEMFHYRREQAPPPFYKRLLIKPGHFRTLIPFSEFSSIVYCGLPYEIGLTPETASDTHLVFRSLDLVTLADNPATSTAKNANQQASANGAIKCVVFDLDNTLWQGTLLEDKNVVVSDDIVNAIKKLDQRGILVSVSSKNTHEHAWREIENAGLAEYFLYPKINWQPKSSNIKQIAADLNIAVNSLLFVDDNQFELDEVGSTIPDITTCHVDDFIALLDKPLLEGSSSTEAPLRRSMYKENEKRLSAHESYEGDIIRFLRSCDIKMGMVRYNDSEHYERVYELVQRTNQLNFSSHKYTHEDLRVVLDNDELDKWVVSCEDKYGHYGQVGFCVVSAQGDNLHIHDFMLSCRVQGKFIEQAVFSFLIKNTKNKTLQTMSVRFRKTDRNAPAFQVLSTLGFVATEESTLSIDLSTVDLECDFIMVNQ